MNRLQIRTSVTAITCVMLSSCGGGGSGGGVNSTPPPAAFSSFANVQAGASTTVSGSTREGSVTIDGTGAILQSGVATPSEGTGSVTFSVNASRQITSLSISGAQSNVSFDANNSRADPLYLNGVAVGTVAYNSTGSNQAVYADPYALGFNYQTFGVWGTGLVPGSTGKYGAISVGAKTGNSSVPTTGQATYRGYAGGIFTDGSVYRYAADATFNVNFANRTVDFSTSNQTLSSVATNNTFSTQVGQISGTMSYSSGSPTFSGNLTATGLTPSRNLSGSGSGTFYGPSANELGGTFFLRGSVNTLIGGFGAKQ